MEEKKEIPRVLARPVGFAERAKRWAEADERERQRKAERAEKARKKDAWLEARKKPLRIWDNYIDVGYVQNADNRRIVLSISTRDGYRYVGIREYYCRRSDNTWWPTPYGLFIPVISALGKTTRPDPNNKPEIIHPMLDILEMLPAVIEAAKSMELVDPANARYKIPKILEEKNEN